MQNAKGVLVNGKEIEKDEWKEIEKKAYNGNDLGAVYYPSKTIFKVWAPTAQMVKLRLYVTGSSEEQTEVSNVVSTTEMEYTPEWGLWSLTVDGDLKNLYYTYLVTVDGEEKETADIYGKAAGVNGIRSMVVDLKETNPLDWEKDNHIFVENPTDAIIWETHVKDFSFAQSSGVTHKNRGKFLAFTEHTTMYGVENRRETCVDYLKKIGVTHVQLMPIYDFATVNEAGGDGYNWGYDPLNYNVPEGSYSSNPFDGNVRIRECKEMIKSLHNAGIGVIMDVVFNHTYRSKDSWFNITVPGYYYRISKDGKWSNGSGCGNDTASERKMFRKYMIDSVLYWAQEYHIDGFRFDLMGLHDVDTMNEIRKALDSLPNGKKYLMYGEGWKMFTKVNKGVFLANHNNMGYLDSRIGSFNDSIRDTLKGSNFDDRNKGFAQCGVNKSGIIMGAEGQCGKYCGWATAPTQTVNYVSCHDNSTLYDKLVSSCIGNRDYKMRYENLIPMVKLCQTLVMTAQGIPFSLGGEEFCRTKYGDKNSYRSAPAVNMIEWENLSVYSDVSDYYAGLIKIRKQFSVLRDPTKTTANRLKFFNNLPTYAAGFMISEDEGNFGENKHHKMVVLLNGSADNYVDVEIEYSDGSNWVVLADGVNAGIKSLGVVSNNRFMLNRNSAAILIYKSWYDEINNHSRFNHK